MAATVGDNSALNSAAKDQLRAFVVRIEMLNEERANLAADIKTVYQEMKDLGFDVKIVRKVVKISSLEQARVKREEEEALIDLYLSAVGWA